MIRKGRGILEGNIGKEYRRMIRRREEYSI
jgi:hypothetical protein